MARSKHRQRIVSIRLSVEEYGELETLCNSTGIDSISELTRSALRLFVRHEKTNGADANGSPVQEIRDRLWHLNREVARLTTHVGLEPMADGENEQSLM